MNWTALWMKIFGTSVWLGVDMGFWVSMGVTALIVIIMNLVFWNMKPAEQGKHAEK